MTRPSVLMYADVNLNLIDGSSVWAASVADALVGAGADVAILPKVPVHDHRVLAPLIALPEVKVLDLEEEGLARHGADQALRDVGTAIETLVQRYHPTVILVRGSEVCDALTRSEIGAGSLWCYLVDVPQAITEAEPGRLSKLNRIASGASKLLCQTERLRGIIEKLVPAAVGKTVLLPPIVPPEAYDRRPEARIDRASLSLVYSGKFAARWRTLEMCFLPADLRRAGVDAHLVMLGDKIHREAADPGYADRMQRTLKDSYGVEWVGGLTRLAALERVRSADVALAWRDPEIDASLELSTKLLEYGASAVPAVLNRTPAHEDLLGKDYPLFAGSYEDVLGALVLAAQDPAALELATDRIRRAAASFDRDSAVRRLGALLEDAQRAVTGKVGWPAGRQHTLLISGHDLKFVHSIAEHLDRFGDTRVILDVWQGLERHNAAASVELLREADVILCEWMLGNAVWYSHHKRPDQRLVIRFHRFEIESKFPPLVNLEAVDAIVCISPDMARQVQEKFGFPKSKTVVIPNAVDVASFARSKGGGHEYVLGMIGVLPALKRLDRAIDLLRQLRTFDLRFRLCVKSKAPWELPWLWGRPDERSYFERVFGELAETPELADAVVFDPSGRDVAEWLRKVGWVVSVSDLEGSHVAVSEGMASGAVPLIRRWPGAEEVYDRRWIHEDLRSMATSVIEVLKAGTYDEMAALAQAEAKRFDLPDVAGAIASVLSAAPGEVPVWRVARGADDTSDVPASGLSVGWRRQEP